MGVRTQRKEKIRRSLMEAALSRLSAERSSASLSLREMAREAGIVSTPFCRRFRDADELDLAIVNGSRLMLHQLMRQARQRIARGGSVIRTSVSIFTEFIGNDPNAFRSPLRKHLETSAAFHAAVAREIQHFIAELAGYLELENHMPRAFTEAQVEAMVTIIFSIGAEALDVGPEQRRQLGEWLVLQLRTISKGAYYWYRRKQEKMPHHSEQREGRAMKHSAQDRGMLPLVLIAGSSINDTLTALFSSIVPSSVFPTLSLPLIIYYLHQHHQNRSMLAGLPGLVVAFFIPGILLYSTVARAGYPDIDSSFFPAILSVAMVFRIDYKIRDRKNTVAE